MPGPPPKRSDQRRRQNKPEVPISTAAAGADPKALHRGPDPRWHPLAKELFKALEHSGQAQFYEASDWAYARFVMELMTRALMDGKLNGQLVTGIDGMLSNLLATEADRRRARIELERKAPEPEPASVAIMAKYRRAAKG